MFTLAKRMVGDCVPMRLPHLETGDRKWMPGWKREPANADDFFHHPRDFHSFDPFMRFIHASLTPAQPLSVCV